MLNTGVGSLEPRSTEHLTPASPTLASTISSEQKNLGHRHYQWELLRFFGHFILPSHRDKSVRLLFASCHSQNQADCHVTRTFGLSRRSSSGSLPFNTTKPPQQTGGRKTPRSFSKCRVISNQKLPSSYQAQLPPPPPPPPVVQTARPLQAMPPPQMRMPMPAPPHHPSPNRDCPRARTPRSSSSSTRWMTTRQS